MAAPSFAKLPRTFLTALLMMTLVLAVCELSAPAASEPPQAQGSLFERRALGFTLETFVELRRGLESLPAKLPGLLSELRSQSRVLGITGSGLIALLIAAIAYGLFGQRRFARSVEAALGPLRERLPSGAGPWLSGAVQVAASGLLPFNLWLQYALVAALTGYRQSAFVIVGSLLLAWTEYAFAMMAIHELVVRPLLKIPAQHGQYVFRIARWLLIYGLLLSVSLNAAGELGVPADVVALFGSLFELSLIILLALFFARRRAIMALFPDLPNPQYRRFVGGLNRVYPLALTLSVVTALLQWAGFSRLANFVWIRTWALAGVVLIAIVLMHFMRLGLSRWIIGERPEHDSAQQFYRSSVRLLGYVELIAVALIALNLIGVLEPMTNLLGARFSSLGNRPLSLLTLVEAVAIVAGFVLAARLVRDYLEFRVYPRLNIDEGVAHAINTFLVYAVTIIGVLSALEAVGLGFGTLTLFAGAMGVGLGFGLQSFANNLASGLTLIFSRSLRKGDWVTVGDTVGMVQEVGMRSTRMRTWDAVEYLIPNSEFVGGKIVNWTHSSPYTRVHVPLGVSCGADPERVRKILEEVANRTPNVQRNPPPEVWFAGFGDSSLNFELLVWINMKQVSPKSVSSSLYFAIFSAFREAEIEIPFPQRDIHIRSDVRTLKSKPG